MKKILLLFMTIAFQLCAAQGGMTQEEYNYLTKGLKIETESGLDPKQGYTLKKYPIYSGSNYVIQVSRLIKSVDNNFKGFSIIINPSSVQARYLAYPFRSKELRADFNYQVSQLNTTAKGELIDALAIALAVESYLDHEIKNKK